jgi:hypothetical protein
MKQKSLFLAIAVLLGLRITATAQTPPAYVPTDGLVGWWPFNGNANDESGNGNNGTVNGATLTEDRFGNGNAAYGFEDDFILIPHSEDFNFENVTVSFWLRTSSSSTSGIIKQMSYEDASFESFGVGISAASSQLGLYGNYNDSECIPGYGWQILESPDNLLNSNYRHVVCVVNFDTLSIYVDGLLSAQEIVPYPQMSPCYGGDIHLGRDWSAFNHNYLGDLDDIGIWNRALTQEEITDLYNANLCYEYITVTDTLIINLGPMGFNPVTYQNTILMYPNPTNDQLTIDYGDFTSLAGYTLKIFNSMGQETHSANINQQQEVLQLGSWGGAGTYQVVIYNTHGVPVDTRTIVLQ